MEEKLQPASPPEHESRHDEEQVTRRSLLMNIGIGLNAVIALAIATPVVAYLFGPITRRKDYLQWITIGDTDDFPPGETKLVTFRNPFANSWDGETANIPAYVRCSAPGQFTAFAINCAHLGCPVRWFSESQLFMCPCHGGVYYADGSRASGPPERGLFTYELKVQEGKLMIYTGQLPTLRNRASSGPCPGGPSGPNRATNSPQLVSRIEPCPEAKGRGTNSPTIG